MTGTVTSLTITLNVRVEVFPFTSVAVYVTGVVPLLKVEPEAMSLTRLAIPQLSVATGAAQLTTALHVELLDETVMFGITGITGLVLSTTITLNDRVEVLPLTSVAV